MASLQELLSTSVTQNLGLSDILRQREQEAQQLGRVESLKGDVEAARIGARSRQKRGLFETVGTILGGTAGFFLGGPTGASIGAKIGQAGGGAVSGQAADPRASQTSGLIQQGIGLAGQLGAQQEAQDIARKKAESAEELASLQRQKLQADIGKTQAETKRLLSKKPSESDRRKEVIQFAKTGKFEPESIKEFEKTGDITSLKRSPEKSFAMQLAEAQTITEAKKIASLEAEADVAREAVEPIISKLSDLSAKSPAGGRVEGILKKGTAAAGVNPEAFALEAYSEAIIPKVARAVFGEKGPIDVATQEKTRKLLPNNLDTKEERDMKIKILQSLVEEKKTKESSQQIQTVQPVSRTSDGRVALSDGTVITREEAEARFGGR